MLLLFCCFVFNAGKCELHESICSQLLLCSIVYLSEVNNYTVHRWRLAGSCGSGPINRKELLMIYGKCSKIPNIFLFLSSNKMLVIRAGIHKMLVRIANREEPDQTASSEAVLSGSELFV